jgi:hypothetical protein
MGEHLWGRLFSILKCSITSATKCCRPWLTGRWPLVIAARRRSGLRLSWQECPLAFDQNFLDAGFRSWV